MTVWSFWVHTMQDSYFNMTFSGVIVFFFLSIWFVKQDSVLIDTYRKTLQPLSCSAQPSHVVVKSSKKKDPVLLFPQGDFGILRKKHLWPVTILEKKVFFSSCESSTRCLGNLMLLFLMLYEEHQAATKPGRDPVQRNSSRPCCQSGSCRGVLFTSPSSLPAEATLSSSLLQGSLLTRAGVCGRPAGWPDINVLPFSIEKKKKRNKKKKSLSSGHDIDSDVKRRGPFTTSEVLS